MLYFFECLLLFFLYTNCIHFLVKLYIGLSSFCNSGQNILRKFTIPGKLLQPFGVVDDHKFCMALSLLLNGLTQTFLSFMNITFPIYCNSVLNSWLFFRDILRSFLSKASNKSSHFAICTLFKGVKSNKSSTIASQCFLLCRHCKYVFLYDCQIEGEIFDPIGIL